MSNSKHKNQLIPPPELGAPIHENASPQQCLRAWVDLMNACDVFLRAGLQRDAGPGGDIRPLYRQWYEREMEDHDRMIEHMLTELSRREQQHAR
jgi:hypothetical protein